MKKKHKAFCKWLWVGRRVELDTFLYRTMCLWGSCEQHLLLPGVTWNLIDKKTKNLTSVVKEHTLPKGIPGHKEILRQCFH